MRGIVAVLAATVALGALAAGAPSGATAQEPSTQEQQQAPAESRTQPPEDDGDDPAGPPIWAGIGLMLLAAVAGTLASRARNRRRMRKYRDE